MTNLPKIKFFLPSFERELKIWREISHKLQATAKKVGNKSSQQLMEQLKTLIDKKKWRKLDEELLAIRGVRTIFTLWAESESYLKKSITNARLEYIFRNHEKLTILALNQFINIYIQYYDYLNNIEIGLLNSFQKYIIRELTIRASSVTKREHTRESFMLHLFRHREMLFSVKAVSNILKKAERENIELNTLFSEIGLLKVAPSGRFHDVCRYQYYLHEVETIPIGEDAPVLKELLNEEVYSTPYQGEQTLGFEAVRILIDRSIGEISESWLDAIVNIAGDPRLGYRSDSYQRYWMALGEERIAKVCAALANVDLRLFLEAVSLYAKQSGDGELQRMYPQRYRFLSGLIDLKLVRNARLMMGSRAASMVKRMFQEREGRELDSHYIKLRELSRHVLIYLDCGDFHIIEGSHSFKIWLYLKRPSPSLMDFEDRGPWYRHILLQQIPNNYKRTYPELPHIGITHNAQWVRRSLQFLFDNGVAIDVSGLTDDEALIREFSLRGGGAPNKTLKRREMPYRLEAKDYTRTSPSSSDLEESLQVLTGQEKEILIWLSKRRDAVARLIEADLNIEGIHSILNGPLKKYCQSKKTRRGYVWSLNKYGRRAVRKLREN